MSEQKGGDDNPGTSQEKKKEQDPIQSQMVFTLPQEQAFAQSRQPVQEPQLEQIDPRLAQSSPEFTVPHQPLRVKRPGRPRIHPPKPVGISKPRGRPRGSKNKKPRKRRDTATKIVERPPKRPRGRPRIWPPEMWEGFQRSQYAAVSQQIHQQRENVLTPDEIPGPSQPYYEGQQIPDQLQHHEGLMSSVPPPLSHLPFHITQQHHIPQPELSLHHPVHQQLHSQQQDPMHLLQPLYLQQPEQHPHPQQEEHGQIPLQPDDPHQFYHEHIPSLHPPHTTS